MNKENSGGIIGTILSIVGTAVQTDEILQIISIIITIIGGLLTILMSIVSWYNKAKKDGKITSKEIEEVISDVKDDVTDLQDAVNKEKGDE